MNEAFDFDSHPCLFEMEYTDDRAPTNTGPRLKNTRIPLER